MSTEREVRTPISNDWWTQNAPPGEPPPVDVTTQGPSPTTPPVGTRDERNNPPTPPTPPAPPSSTRSPYDQHIYDAVAALYQRLLGRAGSADEINGWISGTGGDLDKIFTGISASPEARTHAAQPTGSGGGAGGGGDRPTTAGDAAALTAYLRTWAAAHPNANPSVGRDPGYWAQRMLQTHGSGAIDWGYWEGRMNTPEGPPEGGGGAGNRYGGFTTPPGFYGSNPNAPSVPDAPQWTGGNFVEPALPTALQTPYHLPTQAELEASPGYQARLNATIQGQQRSAAARGSVLSGGSQVELGRQVQDYASNEYGNLVGQTLGARGQQFGEYQTGRGNLYQDYQTKYGQFLDAANLGQQAYQNRYGAYMQDNARTLTDYLTNVSTQRGWQGDYWSRLKDLRDPGANLAGNSYKPPA